MCYSILQRGEDGLLKKILNCFSFRSLHSPQWFGMELKVFNHRISLPNLFGSEDFHLTFC